MCAIFGFVASETGKMPVELVQKIAKDNIDRGPHAFGFAWTTSDGRIRCYKQRGKITDHLGLLAMARDARMFIGHVRWATHGSPGNNLNNHPHPVDGGWLVHNGVVRNYEQLIDEHGLLPVSECDSEAIGLMAELPGDTMLSRYASAVRKAEGQLATLALWARPDRMIVARQGNPLETSEDKCGRFFATLGERLPGTRMAFPDYTVAEYVRNEKGKINVNHESTAGRRTHRKDGELPAHRGGRSTTYPGG